MSKWSYTDFLWIIIKYHLGLLLRFTIINYHTTYRVNSNIKCSETAENLSCGWSSISSWCHQFSARSEIFFYTTDSIYASSSLTKYSPRKPITPAHSGHRVKHFWFFFLGAKHMHCGCISMVEFRSGIFCIFSGISIPLLWYLYGGVTCFLP